MRIICPTCGAAYEVPDHLAVPGRSLRCRKCGHAWRLPTPEEAPATAAAADTPESEGPAVPPEAPPAAPPPLSAAVPLPPIAAMRGAPAMEPPPPPQAPAAEAPDWMLRLAWAASILAVIGLVLALWVFRVEIVAAWPPAARLYLIFGRTPPG